MSKAKTIQAARSVTKRHAQGTGSRPASMRSERGPLVSAEERRHLAECCAFFQAEHYREAAPDTIRKHDVEVVEAQIDEIVRNCTS